MDQPDNSGFGKAIAIVFLLIWTLASAGMSIAFFNFGSGVPSGFGGGVGGAPWFMAIMPIGFTVLGVLMLIKVATTTTASISTDARADAARDEPPPPAVPPPLPAPLACPGCGSRKNPPGSVMCAHCGGTLTSGLA
jgi:hypothetical protein